MLRIIEKDDFELRRNEVEASVVKWRGALKKVRPAVHAELQSKLMISLIYHDSALDGEVLSHSEIQAVVDTSIITDPSLIPAYDEIESFHTATSLVLELAKQKTPVPVNLELIKQVYGILNPAAKAEGMPYRDANPLHRLYYHDIIPPEEVKAAMKKFDKWLASEEFLAMDAIEKVTEFHMRLMAIFPWLDGSGRLSRIMSIFMLASAEYPVPVIHSTDRQAYYEALRSADRRSLMKIYFESIETTANSSIRVFEEAASYNGRRAS